MKRTALTLFIALVFVLGTTAVSFASTTAFTFPETKTTKINEKVKHKVSTKKYIKTKKIKAKTRTLGEKKVVLGGTTYTFAVKERIPAHKVKTYRSAKKLSKKTWQVKKGKTDTAKGKVMIEKPSVKGYALRTTHTQKTTSVSGMSKIPIPKGKTKVANSETKKTVEKANVTYKKLNDRSFAVTYAIPCKNSVFTQKTKKKRGEETSMRTTITHTYTLTYTKK